MNSRILVIEDDYKLSKLFKKVLQHDGYSVTVAPTLAMAQRHMRRETYALLICDVELPDGASIPLMKEWQGSFAATNTRIVVVTGQAKYRTLVETEGITDLFLEKPVSTRVLSTLVARLLVSPAGRVGDIVRESLEHNPSNHRPLS